METKEKHFLQLLNENKGILFKICKIYEDDADDQNDLLQEMTLQLWLAFDSFRGESKFSSWMYRVALNTAIVFFKKQKRRPDSEQLPGNFEQIDDDLNTEKEEQLALFYKAVQQLDKVEKALIYLYMENQTHEEIAENLGITAINARVRLNRIKNKLKEIIKNISYEY
ncbi:RNA polymerase sigma factor [Mucilaginibacter sp. X4EP1]|uniref:RNA polymerase sigma factor n=1 Tax=Mucilaginibacter sp. X4EP1 TaxID=2723092 RepID=UPI00216A7254|nr:sigma-70 family RNA polymerase sigma factor [Mucilaginibacter sp. X4EP1]MCS3812647.1 RNA polymerase sigma-70 factor (ECF subfamily) [Mucilaginibacter sp. X4EP1]